MFRDAAVIEGDAPVGAVRAIDAEPCMESLSAIGAADVAPLAAAGAAAGPGLRWQIERDGAIEMRCSGFSCSLVIVAQW